jgi:predicted nucleotide-binding protein (sugar kinase/HSP70/actin superfamily)
MDYGISTKRMLTPSWWLKNLVLSPMNMNQLDIKKKSKEYLPMMIGGHARECIGEAVLAYEEGFDGAIQIFPMGCMPEIVSKAILPKISKDKDFPIMTLVVDEMTGEAGYVTRIEAFVDLLERRKDNVLSRC